MMNILIFMLFLSSLIFIQLNHPLSITINIIIHTLITCLITGYMSSTFWFSYILFMIFLGGMLVLFLYITSLASNEMFDIPFNMFLLIPMILLAILMLPLLEPFITTPQINSTDMIPSHWLNWSFTPIQPFLMKIYNYPTHLITITLVFYLLLTLVVIVKITDIFKGPLRQSH
uniref:NADH dehydrogenase subunit 6 n=1 Tax=Gryllotalpa henana TaxID=3023679 RepID=UPI0023AB1078|nr:NADH dehydrogenase subunit 6 [Gryllotalpa henana]WCD24136.1 NADH dehydrogenase subunit 6 [Gryllotalpa henana]